MLKNNTIIRITAICIFCFISFFWGCGGESEPEKPDEVRKKISVKTSEVRKKIVPEAAGKPASESVKPAPGKEESKPKTVKLPESAEKTSVPALSSRKPESADKKDIKKETGTAKQPDSLPKMPAKDDKPEKKGDEQKSELAKKEDAGSVADKTAVALSKNAETKKTDSAQPETTEADPKVAAEDDKHSSDEDKSHALTGQPESKPSEEASTPAISPPSTSGEPEKPGDSGSGKAIASIIGLKKSLSKKEGYNSKGKIDPFVPLFEEKKSADKTLDPRANDKKKKKKRIRRDRKTPLEKIDLANLQLKAIILAQSGNKALVEDSTRKGYIIVKGTYIGIHYGKVKEIMPDRVIVEEEDEDPYGEVTLRERVIKIMKPPGEDFMEM